MTIGRSRAQYLHDGLRPELPIKSCFPGNVHSDSSDLLTTGQAARLCSVTPDTVLKWIKRGRLNGVRTAGGHYRVRRSDLDPLLVAPQQSEEASGSADQDPRLPLPVRCWEYLSETGEVREECRQCVVYRVRAARCYLMARLDPDVGHARRFCDTSCQDCVYYRRASGLATRVLVVTRDESLIDRLGLDSDEAVVLRFARNAYEASAVIHDFRPAFAAVDAEYLAGGNSELLDCLSGDSRVPGVKVIIIVPPKTPGRRRRGFKHDLIVGVLERPVGAQSVAELIDRLPVPQLQTTEISPQEPAQLEPVTGRRP